MTPRNRALTAQIKPDTRNAIMDQLAAAANTIINQCAHIDSLEVAHEYWWVEAQIARSRRWWHRLMWWRA